MPLSAAVSFIEIVYAAPMPLCILFPCSAAVFAKAVFGSFKEGDTATSTVLRWNTFEFGAGIAVCTIRCATLHIVPIKTHMPLKIWVIAELVHLISEYAGNFR